MNTQSFLLLMRRLLLLTPGPEGPPTPAQTHRYIEGINISSVQEEASVVNEKAATDLDKPSSCILGQTSKEWFRWQGFLVVVMVVRGSRRRLVHAGGHVLPGRYTLVRGEGICIPIQDLIQRHEYDKLELVVHIDNCFTRWFKTVTSRSVLSLRVTAHRAST